MDSSRIGDSLSEVRQKSDAAPGRDALMGNRPHDIDVSLLIRHGRSCRRMSERDRERRNENLERPNSSEKSPREKDKRIAEHLGNVAIRGSQRK